MSVERTTDETPAAMNLPPPRQRLGVADNTQKRLDTGVYYINMYMEKTKPFGDDNITRFQDLTDPFVAGDNLEKFMLNFYHWFATTPIQTKQKTWLSTEMKGEYQKSAKEAIKARFPKHVVFTAKEYDTWHDDVKSRFLKQCARSRLLDENISEERKSEPLYRDVSGDGCTKLRVKHRDIGVYDCKTVAMNMLKNVKDKKSAAVLSEFNTNRAATGRGGEHALLRWDEGTYDPYFRAPNFD